MAEQLKASGTRNQLIGPGVWVGFQIAHNRTPNHRSSRHRQEPREPCTRYALRLLIARYASAAQDLRSGARPCAVRWQTSLLGV
jgi:hypothetical protein